MTEITNINQLLPLVHARPEFIVQDKKYYFVLDYVYQQADTFDNPLLMECRGIKFDKDGLILARPFRKFFNYGEQGSTLPIHRPHFITEKLDGSMIHPVEINGSIYFMTRKGHTDVAKKAERFILSSRTDYTGFCKAAIQRGYTAIFEFTGPNNRIVLRYDKPALTLLAMRHTVEGHLMDRRGLVGMASMFGVPYVEDFGAIRDPEAFVRDTRNLKDAEGFVVYFDDGYMVKIKAEDYVLQHRALDDLSSKKKIVALCCQGFADDVLPILDERDREELIAFNDQLQKEVTVLAGLCEGFAFRYRGERKQFAIDIAPRMKPAWLAGVVFSVMDGKNARQQVLQAVEKGGYEDLGVPWRGE